MLWSGWDMFVVSAFYIPFWKLILLWSFSTTSIIHPIFYFNHHNYIATTRNNSKTTNANRDNHYNYISGGLGVGLTNGFILEYIPNINTSSSFTSNKERAKILQNTNNTTAYNKSSSFLVYGDIELKKSNSNNNYLMRKNIIHDHSINNSTIRLPTPTTAIYSRKLTTVEHGTKSKNGNINKNLVYRIAKTTPPLTLLPESVLYYHTIVEPAESNYDFDDKNTTKASNDYYIQFRPALIISGSDNILNTTPKTTQITTKAMIPLQSLSKFSYPNISNHHSNITKFSYADFMSSQKQQQQSSLNLTSIFPISMLTTNVTNVSNLATVASTMPYTLPQTVIIIILTVITSTVTIGGNLLVLFAFAYERNLRQPTNYYIVSLAVSDLIIGVCSMPFYSLYLLLGYWPLGEILCDLWLATDYTVCLASQYTVFFITLDRYCSVKIPTKYREWRTPLKVKVMIYLAWAIPIAIFFVAIFGWPFFFGGRDVEPNQCYVPFRDDRIFNTALIFFYYWSMLVILLSLYAGIYKVAYDLAKKAVDKEKRALTLVQNITAKADQDSTKNDGERNNNLIGHVQTSKNKYSSNNAMTIQLKGGKIGAANKIVLKGDNAVEKDKSSSLSLPSDSDSQIVSNQPSKQHVAVKKKLSKSHKDKKGEHKNSFLTRKLTGGPKSPAIPVKGLMTKKINLPFSTSPLINLRKEKSDESSLLPLKSYHSNLNQEFLNPTAPSLKSGVDVSECKQLIDMTTTTNKMPLTCSCSNLLMNSITAVTRSVMTQTSLTYTMLTDSGAIISAAKHSLSLTPKLLKKITNLNIFITTTTPTVTDDDTYIDDSENKNTNFRHTDFSSSDPLYDHYAPEITKDNGNHISNGDTNFMVSTTFNENALQGQNNAQKQSADREKLFLPNLNHEYSVSDSMFPGSQSFQSNMTTMTPLTPYPPISQEQTSLVDKNHDKNKLQQGKNDKSRSPTRPNPAHKQPKNSKSRKENKRTSSLFSSISIRNSQQLASISVEEDKHLLDGKYMFPTKFNGLFNQNKGSGGAPAINLLKIKQKFMRPSDRKKSKSENRARKALRTITCIMGAFILCWTPYHICETLRGFNPEFPINPHFYSFTYWLCYLNSPLNPFMYALANQQFKTTFIKIFKCEFRRS